MYLYFYEAKMIVGIKYIASTVNISTTCITKKNEFDMELDKEFDEEFDELDIRGKVFNRWEIEENNDDTFYLVFVWKNTKYYLKYGNTLGIFGYLISMFMSLSKEDAEPFVFNEDKTVIMAQKNGYKLQPIEENDSFILGCVPEEGKYSKVCLITNSNVDQSYVLK